MEEDFSVTLFYFMNHLLPLQERVSRWRIYEISRTPYTYQFFAIFNYGISLTSHEHKCLEIFHYMISGIIQAKLQGIPSIYTYGKQIVIFMDVLGFTADYFAASEMIDVR